MTRTTETLRKIVHETPNKKDWAVFSRESGNTQVSEFLYQADMPIFAASVNKLAVAHAAELLEVPDDEPLTLPAKSDRIRGTGLLQYFPDRFEITAAQARFLMLATSDNVAAKLLVNQLGGAEVVNEALGRSDVELEVTRLTPVAGGGFYFGDTTAYESALLMAEVTKVQKDDEALASSSVQYGMRAGANTDTENIDYEALVRALRIFRGHGPARLYKAALAGAGLEPNPVRLKEGTLDDSEDNIYVRHQVARYGDLVVAALSKSDQAGPTNRKHPSVETHKQIGRALKLS